MDSTFVECPTAILVDFAETENPSLVFEAACTNSNSRTISKKICQGAESNDIEVNLQSKTEWRSPSPTTMFIITKEASKIVDQLDSKMETRQWENKLSLSFILDDECNEDYSNNFEATLKNRSINLFDGSCNKENLNTTMQDLNNSSFIENSVLRSYKENPEKIKEDDVFTGYLAEKEFSVLLKENSTISANFASTELKHISPKFKNAFTKISGHCEDINIITRKENASKMTSSTTEKNISQNEKNISQNEKNIPTNNSLLKVKIKEPSKKSFNNKQSNKLENYCIFTDVSIEDNFASSITDFVSIDNYTVSEDAFVAETNIDTNKIYPLTSDHTALTKNTSPNYETKNSAGKNLAHTNRNSASSKLDIGNTKENSISIKNKSSFSLINNYVLTNDTVDFAYKTVNEVDCSVLNNIQGNALTEEPCIENSHKNIMGKTVVELKNISINQAVEQSNQSTVKENNEGENKDINIKCLKNTQSIKSKVTSIFKIPSFKTPIKHRTEKNESSEKDCKNTDTLALQNKDVPSLKCIVSSQQTKSSLPSSKSCIKIPINKSLKENHSRGNSSIKISQDLEKTSLNFDTPLKRMSLSKFRKPIPGKIPLEKSSSLGLTPNKLKVVQRSSSFQHRQVRNVRVKQQTPPKNGLCCPKTPSTATFSGKTKAPANKLQVSQPTIGSALKPRNATHQNVQAIVYPKRPVSTSSKIRFTSKLELPSPLPKFLNNKLPRQLFPDYSKPLPKKL